MGSYVNKRSRDLNKPIVDATEPMVLEVKAIDVIRASEKNSKCCAFARAAEREASVEAAFFFRTKAYLEFEDKIVRYALPMSVQKEIVAFDRHKEMDPGTYQLSPPSPKNTLKAYKKKNAKRADKGHHPLVRGASGTKVRVIHRTEGIRDQFEPAYRSRP